MVCTLNWQLSFHLEIFGYKIEIQLDSSILHHFERCKEKKRDLVQCRYPSMVLFKKSYKSYEHT